MPTTLDQIRTAGETRFKRELEKLDRKHREALLAAHKRYGSVRAIPDAVWEEIKRDTENETVALILLLLIAADDWTVDAVRRQGVQLNGQAAPDIARYGLQAARRAQRLAELTTSTTRQRWQRKWEDEALTGEGDVGEVTERGAENSLDEVFTPERRDTTAANETTGAISGGQIGAGRRLEDTVDLQLIWKTEGDDKVCPRCSPLDGTNEDVWGMVFPEGPGEAAHPNCRCELSMRVVVSRPAEAPQG